MLQILILKEIYFIFRFKQLKYLKGWIHYYSMIFRNLCKFNYSFVVPLLESEGATGTAALMVSNVKL